jgi:hypothetical protein
LRWGSQPLNHAARIPDGMRIGVFLLGLALLAAPALSGHAASDPSKPKPAAKLKLPTGLRGAVPAANTALNPGPNPGLAALATPLTPTSRTSPAPKPLASLVTPVVAAPDVGQCRIDCAHSYYFCPSEPSSTECSSTWSQCVTGCSHPPLTIERVASDFAAIAH